VLHAHARRRDEGVARIFSLQISVEVVAQARRRAKDTRDGYYLHILDLDVRPGSWGRGNNYHRGGRSSDKSCSAAPKWTTESRDLACPVSCGQPPPSVIYRFHGQIGNPVLYGSSSEAPFRSLVSGRKGFLLAFASFG
jgi:hypothetical protein